MDPVTLQVVNNALCSIAEEMGEVLASRSLSPAISQKRNFSTAIYSTAGLLAALGHHVPIHLGPLHSLARAVLQTHPLHSLSGGDSVLTNDPYLCGLQPPWFCVISPVYCSHTPLALVASIANHSDAGGLAPGSTPTGSTEIFQEGCRIPPVKIAKKGEIDSGLLMLISSNLRTPRQFSADLKAQLSAARFAGKRLNELAGKYGPGKIKLYMTEIMNRTGESTRESLNLPQSPCAFEDYIEDGGLTASLNINLTISKNNEFLTFDFTGTHSQVETPLNAPRELALSGVYYGTRAVFCPDMPVNDGFFRPINVITPRGSLINPVFPAPVALAGSNTVQRVADTVFGCLAKAVPERIESAGAGCAFIFTAGGTASYGEEYRFFSESHGGGQGAGAQNDGMDGVSTGILNLMSTPVEIMEREFPILVNGSGLITDSGGAGRFRGGTGIKSVYTLLNRSFVTVVSDGPSRGPWGAFGGLPGRTARVYIEKNTGGAHIASGKFSGILEEGCAIAIETAGGGGYGPPLERDPEAVRKDVLEGHVSREQAAGLYGVILLEPDLRVDHRATEEKRLELADP